MPTSVQNTRLADRCSGPIRGMINDVRERPDPLVGNTVLGLGVTLFLGHTLNSNISNRVSATPHGVNGSSARFSPALISDQTLEMLSLLILLLVLTWFLLY